jgi:hypothetical protein
MVARSPQLLDIVELRVDCGRWPAGTVGTVVEADEHEALIEVSDDRGHALDFIALPHHALAQHPAHASQVAS